MQKTLEEHLERKELFGSKLLEDIAAGSREGITTCKLAWDQDQLHVHDPPTPVDAFPIQSPLLDNVLLLKRNMHLRDRQQAWRVNPSFKRVHF